MSVNDLPPETIGDIFEFLPRHTLYHCSLVNWSWHLISKPLLWRHVRLSMFPDSSRRMTLIRALRKNIADFDNFRYTVHLELNLDFYVEPAHKLVVRWARNYWLLRRNLAKFARLQTLSIVFPGIWGIPEIGEFGTWVPAASTFPDIPKFVKELTERGQINHLDVSYIPSEFDEFTDTLFTHVWELRDIVTKLSIRLETDKVELIGLESMGRLKTLEFEEAINHDSFDFAERRIDLRRSPIETLTLNYNTLPHQIQLPITITDLTIHYWTETSWALELGLTCLPNLQHFNLSTEPENGRYDDEEMLVAGQIISTKLQSLKINVCKFPSVYLQWIAESCTQLTSLQFRFICHGSKFTNISPRARQFRIWNIRLKKTT